MYGKNCFQHSYDDEIVELEKKFRNAYILKSLEAQLAEKEANRVAHEAQERLYLRMMAREHKTIMEIEANDCLKSRKDQCEAYKNILQKQIAMKKEQRVQEVEFARIERNILQEVDELTDKMYEFNKFKNRNLLKIKLKREKLIFDEVREIKRAIDDEIRALEVERDRIFFYEKIQNIEKSQEYQQSIAKNRQALIDQVAKMYTDINIDKCKRQEIISELLNNDIHYELAYQHECEEQLHKINAEKRLQHANDLTEQMKLSIECETRARKQDKIFAEKVMTKVMEDESMAILTAEARKRKQVQYKEDLEKLILDRMRTREMALARMRSEVNDTNGTIEVQRREKIKEERRRLIVKHADNIAHYLQHGIFTDEEEEIVKRLLDKCREI